MEVGARVWLRSNTSQWGWVPCVVARKEHRDDARRVRLTLEADADGSSSPARSPAAATTLELDAEDLRHDHDDVKLRNNDDDDDAVHDLVDLTFLHEPAILHALRLRYDADVIYTSTGPILLAVNPFRRMEDLYDRRTMDAYRLRGEDPSSRDWLPPHAYGTADDAYRAMMRASAADERGADQSVLVSGESGAGKTVTTKIVLTYLAMLSRRRGGGEVGERPSLSSIDDVDGRREASVEQQVLQSNPILESFGNARTLRNDNSSRFGKYIDVRFDRRGRLAGARVETYLLEKVRLAAPGKGERNYHVFYQLLASDAPKRRALGLSEHESPRDFRLLAASDTYDRRDGADDADHHKEMLEALRTVGFSEEAVERLLRLVVALLRAGNLRFVDASSHDHESCRLAQDAATDAAARALRVDAHRLAEALTTRRISAGAEYVTMLLDEPAARKGVEALVKAAYGAVFRWLVAGINESVVGTTSRDAKNGRCAHIGVLDIFGFESFQSNSFEQLCINYANEALQQQFNRFVFRNEQKEYQREGILWKYIDFPDNEDVLHLIDKRHVGILALLDEQRIVPGSNDERFCRYLYSRCDSHPRFRADGRQKSYRLFGVEHYAGVVEYGTDGWLEKNKDELSAPIAALLASSECSLLGGELAALYSTPPEPVDHPHSTPSRRSDAALVAPSVGAQFSAQLRRLRARIDATRPHYVRCLKPNDDLVPRCFRPRNVVEQLRCGGVLEAVRVSRAGYPTRFAHEAFLGRYGILGVDVGERCVSSRELRTSLGRHERDLRQLVDRVARDVWAAERDRRARERERRETSNKEKRSYTVDTPRFAGVGGRRAESRASNMSTTSNGSSNSNTAANPRTSTFNVRDPPDSEEDFAALPFHERCAVAGLQMGRTKVFLRREAFERMEAVRSRRYFDSASTLQRAVRGHCCRVAYLRLRAAAIKAQSAARMWSASSYSAFRKRSRAAVRIQSVWRMAETRSTVWGCYLEMKTAAMVIQRAVRRHTLLHRTCAVRIQKRWRGTLARCRVAAFLRAIIALQSFHRGAISRSRVLNARDPVSVQRFVRAHHLDAHADSPTSRRRHDAPFSLDPDVEVDKTDLYTHIENEDWAAVESVLDRRPESAKEIEPASGELPLHVIARHPDAWALLVDMVLVSHPAALVHRDRSGASAVHHAAAHDNVAALEILHAAYREGAHETDDRGRLPVHVAAEFDAVEAVKFLLSKAPEGAYTMVHRPKDGSGGGLPLHVACRHHASIGVVTAFLAENFASAKRTDENGDLPLHLLLRSGKNVDQVVVKTLLTCFALAVSRTDMHGDLPLAVALRHKCRSNVISTLLVQYPEAAKTVNGEGHHMLHLALQHGAEDRTVLGLLNHAPELATTVDKPSGLLPIQMATQNEHSPFIVHNLLRRDMPIDLKEKVRAQLLPHHYSWNHLVTGTSDLYHTVVNKLLQQCTQPQVLALAHVEGPDGRIALAAATPVCKYELRVMLRLFNTLEVVNQRPAYTNPVSDTQIFYALRYEPPPTRSDGFTLLHEDRRGGDDDDRVEDLDDASSRADSANNDDRSARTSSSRRSVEDRLRSIRKEKGQQVIAKLTSRAEVVERELRVRKDHHLSRHYVPAIISVHHTVQHAAYSEAMAEPGYCITMEGADTTAENLILDLRKSGRLFPAKALKRIGVSLLHMHERGIVHCDFGTHNIGKFGSRWKLLGVGASVPIGRPTDPRRGFYHPPESIVVETRRAPLGKKSVQAHVRSVAASPTYDVWAYGVVLYESVAGVPLAPYACRGKRDMNQSEIARIGRWDDHNLRKAIKLIESDDERAKDLIRRLLHPDPTKRTDSMRRVLEHPFFQSSSSGGGKAGESSSTHKTTTTRPTAPQESGDAEAASVRSRASSSRRSHRSRRVSTTKRESLSPQKTSNSDASADEENLRNGVVVPSNNGNPNEPSTSRPVKDSDAEQQEAATAGSDRVGGRRFLRSRVRHRDR